MGTDGWGGSGGSGGVGGRGGIGTGDGGPIVVDTTVVDEALGRAERAGERSTDAAHGLQRLPVVGVVTGADAVLDALGDLGRQWLTHLEDATAQARATAEALRTARTQYVVAELEAERASRTMLAQTLERAMGGTP